MNRFDFAIKSFDGLGAIEGLASTYGNEDRVGDVVVVGAFTRSLAETGGRVPLLWQHQQDEPIGVAQLRDTPVGLALQAQIDLDVEMGRRAYSSIKKGIVGALSIGYEAVKAIKKNGTRHLQEIKLFEVSVVTIPANANAAITAVKHDATVRGSGGGETDAVLADLSRIAAEVGILASIRGLRSLAQEVKQ